MLNLTEMKSLLQKDLPRLDKVLLLLSTSHQPQTVLEIRNKAKQLGLRKLQDWNISDILGKSAGKAVLLPQGWELSDDGKAFIVKQGYLHNSPTLEIAQSLRNHLDSISQNNTKAFVEEAIKCHENGLYRSAIIMSWLSAIDVLYNVVIENHLTEFNTEAKRVNNRWKNAQNADDLAKMKESDFLDRLEGISVVGKNPKQQLIEALTLRNACGHPNSLQIGAHKSAAHLETLLQNVFEVFCYQRE